MELATISLKAAKEASKAALEGAKKIAENTETKLDFGKLGEKLEPEHISLGKIGLENSEVPVRFGSKQEEFFCNDLMLPHLTSDIGSTLTNIVKEFTTPRHLSTINEDLEGQTYPGTNIRYKRHTFILNGEKVEGVFPRFESKFDTTLPKNLLNASDTEQFKYCTQRLAKQIENNPLLALKFTPRQIEQIKNGEPRISGLTWHHNEVPGKMQLVNADVHSTCRHTGGRSIWGGGSKCR